MADNTWRIWFRFRLRSLFWSMLCIGIGIGAYRQGYDAGSADRADQRYEVGNAYASIYYVGTDLRSGASLATHPPVDWDGLIHEITVNVLPNTWNENGGQASIRPFESNFSLVVHHDQDGHERVADYLEKRRRESKSQLQLATK